VKRIASSPKFVVYDDVLSPEENQHVWYYVQNEEYAVPQQWIKVWRMGDKFPQGSREYFPSKLVPKTSMPQGMAIASDHIIDLLKANEEILGKEGDTWNQVVLRSYIYPRETKLSWHNDAGYVGAIILYTHQYWGSTWGGELLVAETSAKITEGGGPLDTKWRDDMIGHFGMGHYITPKPNRVVITGPGVWHQIARVDADAGENCRCSIVGFLKKV
jgi:hypothetical protein